MSFSIPALRRSFLTTSGFLLVLAFLLMGCEPSGDSKSSEAVLRINCGGPEVDGWVEDGPYLSKRGRNYRFGNKVARSKVSNPAPEKVYESVRHQQHSYRIPLPEGRYQVRLHFTDAHRSARRAMDFRINGQLVIDDLNVEKAAGGTDRALVREAVADVATGEPLTIEADKDRGTDVFVAGIEIIAAGGSESGKKMPEKQVAAKSKSPPKSVPMSSPDAPADPTGIRAFTGAPTKLVWLEGSKWELYTQAKSRVRLMGLDTEDGAGPRDLLGKEMALSKPLITPDGKSIVVTDRAKGRILQVDWKSGQVRDLAEGWASDVWADPKSGRMWVYHRSGKGRTKDPVKRFPLDDPKTEETVWTNSATGHDGVPWIQLSADGRHFADAFPWNRCGLGSFGKKDWEYYTKGCWPGMSPDNSYRMYIFDGSHRHITMFDGTRDKKRKIDLSNIPGQKGKQVYHPQWSNHPRFLTLSAPERSDRNEVYLGRFDSQWKGVEQWIQVTNNKRAESFSDAWVASGTVAR